MSESHPPEKPVRPQTEPPRDITVTGTVNVHDQADGSTATGVYIESIEAETVHLSSADPPQPWWRRWSAWIIGAIGLMSSVLGIVAYIAPFMQPPPVMTGGFNVAVTSFGQADATGNITDSREGRDAANEVYQQLQKELTQLPSDLSFQVLSPQQLNVTIRGTEIQRVEAAQKLAEQIKADLIIYGYYSTDQTSLTPELYLAPRTLSGAEEIVGPYTFSTISQPTAGIAGNAAASRDLSRQIAARSDIFAQFALGLGYYALQNFLEARSYFAEAQNRFDAMVQHAESQPTINVTEDRRDALQHGRELIYLLQGNTEGRLKEYSAAEGYYRQALSLVAGYSRAHIGLAGLLVERGKQECEPDKIDVEMLDRALAEYETAYQAPVQPPTADIATKIQFGRGQVHLCLSYAGVRDEWTTAEQEFLAIVAEYEAGNQRVQELAARAHANLGAIYIPFENETDPVPHYQRAANQYEQAITLIRRNDLKAVYESKLGYVYHQLGRHEQADAAYKQAIALAVDSEQRAAFEREWQAVVQERGTK